MGGGPGLWSGGPRRQWVACVALLIVLLPFPSPAQQQENRLDRFNRVGARFNHWMLQHAVKPVAKGYNLIVPKLAQEAIANLLLNLERPRDIANSLLQGKPRRAGRHLAILLLNSTFGAGGIFYVSHRVLDDDSPETFNETLGTWGVPPGPYLVLPLVVPPLAETSPRRLLGTLVDLPLNPLFWIPGTTGTIASASGSATGGLNAIASLMPVPWASDSEWEAFETFFGERTPYPDQKLLFYQNQQLDVED
jgi:ABC-type transporter lipoprotein component MlaA